jgi:hypothetical protein
MRRGEDVAEESGLPGHTRPFALVSQRNALLRLERPNHP